ncbi:MAG: phosphoribosylglycinamide formyltransferase [Acetobacteraceae bacterium]|nr:phosphoribosylglycinamide formyltransferase [Acetobacteraceae bacterium]
MRRLRVGVLISGRGSNLQALVDACAAEAYPAEVVLIISSRAEAPGLGFATAAGIPAAVVPHRDRRAFADTAERLLLERKVQLVCLAGFMRILASDFVEAWRDRMVNIHPSLLPAFRGLHAQRQALTAGVRFAGCTVHFVRPELDTGPIIAQAVVPVHPDDDEAALSARILAAEHRLYPLAVRLIAEGRVRVIRERVEIIGAGVPDATMMNPQNSLGEALASRPA